MTAKNLLALALHLPVGEIPDDARINNFPLWDSLAHATLIILLEEQIGRSLEIDELLSTTELGAIDEILAVHEKSDPRALRNKKYH